MIQRIIRITKEEVGFYLALILFGLLVVVVFLFLQPISEAPGIPPYPVLILAILLVLIAAVLLLKRMGR